MFKAIKSWIISFLHIQLIITLFSLPIFIMWGLPVSILALLGNLIFSPLLALFIALCCLITFCELLQIPHSLADQCLEFVGKFWYKLLSLSSPQWLTGCPIKLLPLTITCCSISYFLYKKYNPSKKDLVKINSILLLIIFSAKSFIPNNALFNYDHMHVIQCNNQTICIDNGTFSRKRSPQSWIDYTLLSDLVKYTGSPQIDTFISFKNNKRTYRAAKLLERQAGISKIILPSQLQN